MLVSVFLKSRAPKMMLEIGAHIYAIANLYTTN
jgi:hypothetical protein